MDLIYIIYIEHGFIASLLNTRSRSTSYHFDKYTLDLTLTHVCV